MDTLTFDGNVITPSGTPLGGWIHVEVSDNGDFYVKFHMHSSSVLGNFVFNLRAYLTAPGFPTMAFVQSGHVSGVDGWDQEERGNNPLVALYWTQLKASPNYGVAKDYKWGGIVGSLEDLVKDIFDLAAGAAGAAFGVVIGATREAISWLGSTLGPGGTLGVVGGVVVFVVATVAGAGVGGAIVLGIVAGVAIGAVTNAMIHYRPLDEAERAVARQVFGDTLRYDDIIITNLGSVGNRGFTAAGVDGKTYCNLGHAYDNPLGAHGKTYPYPGQLLIHELVHAWQIAHSTFLPGLMCSQLVTQAEYTLGDNVYAYGPAGPEWSAYNPEQQGAIVDQWFGGNGRSSRYQAMDQENPYYRYIWNDVLRHAAPSTAIANLRASSSTGLDVRARYPNRLDVFWVTPDGAIGTHWWDAAPNQGWANHTPFTIAPPGTAAPGSPVNAVARTPDHLDVFWVTPDGAIGTHWWDAAPNQGWANHTPFTIAPPGTAAPGSPVNAVARTPDHLDVFWVTPDGAIGTHWWDAAPNQSWANHTPFTIAPPGTAAPGSPVNAVARTPDHLDVFWVTPDGAIGTHWWDAAPNQGWANHTPFTITVHGTVHPGSSITATGRLYNHLDVFWATPDEAIMTHWWDGAPGQGWADHSPFAITGPGATRVVAPPMEPLIAVTIPSLASIGVDFSVPESDLTDWLDNPDFTPYPAVGEALLRLLAGHRLRRPVFIDVIVFNYENTAGVDSPRKVQDVQIPILKKTVLDASNSRYDEGLDDFQKLVAPLV